MVRSRRETLVCYNRLGASRRRASTRNPGKLQEIAESIPRRVRSELVFGDAEGAPLRNYEVSKLIKVAMIRAGIKDASADTLRHTFASRLAQRGAPMQAIADLLGQNVATTTAMHLQPEHLRRAMAVL